MPTAIEKNLSRIPCIRARASADGSRRRGLWRDTAGAISVIYALVLPGLIGMVGLGVETGYWYVAKRDLQTQADAGSLSGAWEVAFHRDDEVTPTATNEAVRNGFPNTPPSTSITVNHPPTSGPQAGNTKAVEVIVTQKYHPMFSGLFHSDDITIAARAVSTLIMSGEACVHALDGTVSGAASNTGSTNIDAACTIAADSTAADAISFGGSSDIHFQSAWTPGGVETAGSANVTLTDGAWTNMWPLDDPYKNLWPTPPTGCDPNINLGNGTTQVTAPNGSSPNNYRRVCSDIHVTGGKTVNFEPGIYWMKGSSLNAEGGTITCTACSPGGAGVTFIFTTPSNGNVNQIGTVTINGNATVVLNAPGSASATYKGVLFYQSQDAPTASNKTASLNGGANTVLNGAIYFPKNEVQWAGNNSLAAGCTIITANTVTFTGNSGFRIDDCKNQGIDPIALQKITLVE